MSRSALVREGLELVLAVRGIDGVGDPDHIVEGCEPGDARDDS
jgi:hypothetical protein